MVLYYAGRAYHIEMKDAKGKQQPDQKKWEQIITAQGFDYHIIRSFEEFQTLIQEIVK